MIEKNLANQPSHQSYTAFKRIQSLDYMRGLLAVAVMVYHYASWSGMQLNSETVLGRLGIYAVSMFYILSGLSLGIVYRGRLNRSKAILDFYIKRVFRIFPLFWLALCLTLAYQISSTINTENIYIFDKWKVFLNFSLLFGFLEPTAYLTTGAWSIGNEMVFYALFPLILLIANKGKWSFNALLVLIMGIGLIFAYYFLDPIKPLTEQWSIYINPFNQLPFFVAGVALSSMKPTQFIQGRIFGVVLLLIASVTFTSLPAIGDKIVIVTGSIRIMYFLVCVLAVSGVYLSGISLRGNGGAVMTFLGESCYSIYLLHPVIAGIVVGFGHQIRIASPYSYAIAVAATFLVSWLTYRWLEKPMMNYAKKLININK